MTLFRKIRNTSLICLKSGFPTETLYKYIEKMRIHLLNMILIEMEDLISYDTFLTNQKYISDLSEKWFFYRKHYTIVS